MHRSSLVTEEFKWYLDQLHGQYDKTTIILGRTEKGGYVIDAVVKTEREGFPRWGRP